MNHASLFSGIGGFDLAAEYVGWNNVFNCEINPFCQKVLKYHWPNAKQYDDIKLTDFTIWRGQIDVLTGGFPCQPFSLAGKRKGTEDDRHLWPEMLRAIREINPAWVVGENVFGITNWSDGLVFEQVQADLEAEGYEVQPFILPACAVNAPHRRDRVWFVAKNTISDGCLQRESIKKRTGIRKFRNACAGNSNWICLPSGIATDTGLFGQEIGEKQTAGIEQCCERNATDTNINLRRKRRVYSSRSEKTKRHTRSRNAQCYRSNTWDNFPTQSPVCSRNDGLSSKLDGITFSNWRNESIKAYGNAIVPQVALQIFNAIEQYEALTPSERQGED